MLIQRSPRVAICTTTIFTASSPHIYENEPRHAFPATRERLRTAFFSPLTPSPESARRRRRAAPSKRAPKPLPLLSLASRRVAQLTPDASRADITLAPLADPHPQPDQYHAVAHQDPPTHVLCQGLRHFLVLWLWLLRQVLLALTGSPGTRVACGILTQA